MLVKVAFKSEYDKKSYNTLLTVCFWLFFFGFFTMMKVTIFDIEDIFEMRISNSIQLHTYTMHFALKLEYLSHLSTQFHHFASFCIIRKHSLNILHQISTLWPNIYHITYFFRFRNTFYKLIFNENISFLIYLVWFHLRG